MNMQSSIAAARVSGPSPQPDGGVVFEFRFPAGDPVFTGHFPGRPILPGVFQLEMARWAAGLAPPEEASFLVNTTHSSV